MVKIRFKIGRTRLAGVKNRFEMMRIRFEIVKIRFKMWRTRLAGVKTRFEIGRTRFTC
jgi:hypothetical protein